MQWNVGFLWYLNCSAHGACVPLVCGRFIDMAESLCQKRALAAFRLDPEKWGGWFRCALSSRICLMLLFPKQEQNAWMNKCHLIAKYSWPLWLCEDKSYWRVFNSIIVASLVSSECATPFWITSELSSVYSSFETTWTYHGLGSSPRWSFVSWISGMTGGMLRLIPFELMRNHILYFGRASIRRQELWKSCCWIGLIVL